MELPAGQNWSPEALALKTKKDAKLEAAQHGGQFFYLRNGETRTALASFLVIPEKSHEGCTKPSPGGMLAARQKFPKHQDPSHH